MNRPIGPVEELKRAISEAHDRASSQAREREGRTGTHRLGDLLMVPLPDGVEDLLQWAVVLDRTDDPDPLFVVPADYFPMTGSSDVLVPEDSPCGPIALRCGLGFWTRAASLVRAARTGELDLAVLESVREKIAERVAGAPDGTPLECATDVDPEYADHIASLQELVARVVRSLREGQTEGPRLSESTLDAPQRDSKRPAARGRSQWLSRYTLVGIISGAAVVLLAVWVPRTTEQPPAGHDDLVPRPDGTYRPFPARVRGFVPRSVFERAQRDAQARGVSGHVDADYFANLADEFGQLATLHSGESEDSDPLALKSELRDACTMLLREIPSELEADSIKKVQEIVRNCARELDAARDRYENGTSKSDFRKQSAAAAATAATRFKEEARRKP